MEREGYAHAIVETIRQPLIVLDEGQRVRSVNPAFLRLFETDVEHTEDRMLWELGDSDWDVPALRQLVDELVRGGAPIEDFEVRHEFARLGVRTFLVNARRVRARKGEPPLILVAFEDVTEHRRAESELKRYAQQLERSNRDLEEFAPRPMICRSRSGRSERSPTS